MARERGLLDEGDELLTLRERAAPSREIRVPADSDFAKMSFASVGRSIAVLRKDTVMADPALLNSILVMLVRPRS